MYNSNFNPFETPNYKKLSIPELTEMREEIISKRSYKVAITCKDYKLLVDALISKMAREKQITREGRTIQPYDLDYKN